MASSSQSRKRAATSPICISEIAPRASSTATSEVVVSTVMVIFGWLERNDLDLDAAVRRAAVAPDDGNAIDLLVVLINAGLFHRVEQRL